MMGRNSSPPSSPGAAALWFTVVAALSYCGWLGWHWLPLHYTDGELSAGVSRVWDIRRELVEHGRLPWWTPYYMSGSSYALHYAQGLPLLVWLAGSVLTSLPAAGKLMALGAMFLSALAMHACARRLLGHPWAATLAALAFLLHPQQLNRAAAAEHVGVSVAFVFIPLVWLCGMRAVESGRFRDALTCALAVTGLVWTSSKQAIVILPFVAAGAIVFLWPIDRWRGQRALRAGGSVLLLSVGLCAFCIVPMLSESRHVKLFAGDPIERWQHYYAFKSLLSLVDRDAVVTGAAVEAVRADLQVTGGRVRDDTEAARIQRVLDLQVESPEKYTGLLLLALALAGALFDRQRAHRGLFWFFAVMLATGVAVATGPDSIWSANRATLQALFAVRSVPIWCRAVVVAMLAAAVVVAGIFARRKLTNPRRWAAAGAAAGLLLLASPFRLLGVVPVFREVRAPFVFYDLPCAFAVSMLAGFFVTDVLPTRWRSRAPLVVTALGLAILVDHWPSQRPAKLNDLPLRTLHNLESVYRSLRKDEDWVKTYAFSTRYFHLLGPMYSGKPQLYEAWTDWMGPLGIGLLAQHQFDSPKTQRAFLDLMGVRYPVFDKTDPINARPNRFQLLAEWRRLFAVQQENEDFVLFRNDAAHSYVTAYRFGQLFVGDVRAAPRLALELAALQVPLVHTPEEALAAVPADRLRRYDVIYVHGEPPSRLAELPEDIRRRITPVSDGGPLPSTAAGVPVALRGVDLRREHSGLVRMAVDAPEPCLVVVAENYYPMWHARVDGEPAELLRVDCALMGLELLPGRHEIVLRYEPPRAYGIAAAVSVLTFLGGTAAVLWQARRRC
jgi:hypothetical protein